MENQATKLAFDSQANALIQRIAEESEWKQGFGSMTSAIYDTSWVSMISKTVGGTRRWLFPECFKYILDANVLENNPGPHSSGVPEVLNALAALLALKVHYNADNGQKGNDLPLDIWHRMSTITCGVEDKLRNWKVEDSQHVGFEMLVPALLGLLEREGISFDFPGRQALFELRDRKLARFDVGRLYGQETTTTIHSLEAFVGLVDFDRLGQHKLFGSMMGSPSSTAAYLMNVSKWDDEAEGYLRNVIANGHGRCSGGIPGAFPSTIFEVTWVASTLLENGYSAEVLGTKYLQTLSDYLKAQIEAGKGIVGFAPSSVPDVDDCAKTFLTLRLLGKPVALDRMIEYFEANDHFRTYASERNPSFSANCNVLNCFLHVEQPSRYIGQINKAAIFLCNGWWNDSVADKWNLSPHYAIMLLTQAFSKLLRMWDEGYLPDLDSSLRRRLPIVMCQAVIRTLRSQTANGSWDNSAEITSYAVLTLLASAQFPWTELFEAQIDSAIQRGRDFVGRSSEKWKLPEYIWVAKVNYGSATLCEAYCLAAMNASKPQVSIGSRLSTIAKFSPEMVSRTSRYLANMPLFADELGWKLVASTVEGFLFLPLLDDVRGSILLRGKPKQSKYLPFIACTWTSAAYLENSHIEPYYLWEMMRFSLLTFETDEYIEGYIAAQLKADLEDVKHMISDLIKDFLPASKVSSNGKVNGIANKGDLIDVREGFSRLISYLLRHSDVEKAHHGDQMTLAQEVQTFLLAQLDQCIDSLRFSSQCTTTKSPAGHIVSFDKAPATYYDWVHTTAANHLAGPTAFAFISALLSGRGGGEPCFRSVQEKYMAQDVARHSSILSRQLNDLGSIRRDGDECNLNSVNFPEFHDGIVLNGAVGKRGNDGMIRSSLLHLAEYERDLLQVAMARFQGILPFKTRKILKWYVLVVDLWGEIYIYRDLSNYN